MIGAAGTPLPGEMDRAFSALASPIRFPSEQHRIAALRMGAYQEAKQEILSRRDEPVSPDLERRFNRGKKLYLRARPLFSFFLLGHDPGLWRVLGPGGPGLPP